MASVGGDGCMLVVVGGGSWAAPALTDGCMVMVVGGGSWAAPAFTDGCTSTAGGDSPVKAGGGGGVCLTTSASGGTDTVGEDTGDTCMDVVEVSASEVCVLLGVVMMLAVDIDVLHAGVSVDITGREVEEEEETVEAVDVVMSSTVWCLLNRERRKARLAKAGGAYPENTRRPDYRPVRWRRSKQRERASSKERRDMAEPGN
ncbi:hypothetical protein NDU88_003806 [Pleurodeles waltl]|uniref:Uncharacterized protein n=1 Tax=Pleurodeles waltl TaxID=8319 RepID=A0AAV7UD64_PLEWA|nr:hypothetical protein NDU88_003806 [Pleurodeles waltl]